MDWLDLLVAQGREYYKKLYANKMGSLEEISKFLERYNLLKLNQEKIETTTSAFYQSPIFHL